VDASPDSLLALGLIAAALGMRHGLDADHLAAIDGLARFNSSRNPRLARWSGACFALGHGIVVITIAGTLSVLASRWQAPTALVSIGAWRCGLNAMWSCSPWACAAACSADC